MDAITETETRLARLGDDSSVVGEPDRRWVDDWVHHSYLDYWTRPPCQT